MSPESTHKCLSLIAAATLDVISFSCGLAGCWWLIWPLQNDAKALENDLTLPHGYSSESLIQIIRSVLGATSMNGLINGSFFITK